MRRFVLRLLNMFRHDRAEDDLDREVSSHLAFLQDEYRRRGLSSDDARLAARRALGSTALAKDLHRDARAFRWLEDLRQDVRHTLRGLRRTPGFTAVAVLTVALGVGANVAIYSVVNAVLLQPLPYADSGRLVRVIGNMPAPDGSSAIQRGVIGVLLSDMVTLRSQVKTLSHIGVYAGTSMMLTGDREASRVEVTRLSPAVLEMLGSHARIGRTFTPQEEAPGSDPVVILSDGFWRRRFGGRPDVPGRSVTLDGRTLTVVGVMPEGFQFPDSRTELWIPYTLDARALRATVPPIARLADGASIQSASTEIDAILRQLKSSRGPESRSQRFELVSVLTQLVAPLRPALLVLTVAAGFVLLIACANIANLLLARTTARTREIALRVAIGASHSRLVRQLFTESLLLAVAGAVAGTALALGGVQLLHRLGAILPRGDLPVDIGIPRLEEIGIDLSVLIYTTGVALVTGVLSGLAPILGHVRTRPATVLRAAGASLDAGFNLLGRHRTHGLLVIAEIAMATVLLVGSGLLMRSFVNLLNVDPGYDRENVLTFNVFSASARRPSTFDQDFAARLRTLPAVRATGYAELLPMVRFSVSGPPLRRELDPPPSPAAPGSQAGPAPEMYVVSQDFMRAMGMRVIQGRGFTEQDGAGRPPVLLINRKLARSGFLGPNPVGIRVYPTRRDVLWEVIGVVDDVRQHGLDEEPREQIFVDVRQFPSGNPNVYYAVRTDGDPIAVASTIRTMARQLDPRAMVDNVATMDQLVANSVSRRRLYAVLLGVFASVAMILAAVGLFGVLAYVVASRTREIGVRVALGAQRAQVIALVLRQTAALTAIGVIAGVAAAAALSRYLEGLLFGVTPLDLTTFALVIIAFGTISAFASYVPARRATGVDPMVALRSE